MIHLAPNGLRVSGEGIMNDYVQLKHHKSMLQ